jgi:hypothetical protein
MLQARGLLAGTAHTEARMEVRDGFIAGIFNYCDSWCERCAFTSHCRLFADQVRVEASLDPHLTAVAEAPPLPEEIPPPPPTWMRELIDAANEACNEPISGAEWDRMRPRLPAEHAPIGARAKDYAMRTHQWLTATGDAAAAVHRDARDIIAWFHFLIAAKIDRALTQWPDDGGEHDVSTSDGDGSAKVALLGIDRSHAAWLDLLDRGAMRPGEADSFVADLVWLGEALERVRPNARAFVRPGFDEPDAVARLFAAEGGR